MPISYQFLYNDKSVSLDKLDRWACRLDGSTYSTTTWSATMFNAVYIVGPRAAHFAGGFTATEGGFNKWKEESICMFGRDHYDKHYAEHEELLRDLVYRRFTYKCWRGG